MSKTRYRWKPVFGAERWCQFLGENVVPALCGRSGRCCSSHVMVRSLLAEMSGDGTQPPDGQATTDYARRYTWGSL